jgi:hypothetical protein
MGSEPVTLISLHTIMWTSFLGVPLCSKIFIIFFESAADEHPVFMVVVLVKHRHKHLFMRLGRFGAS